MLGLLGWGDAGLDIGLLSVTELGDEGAVATLGGVGVDG